MAFNVGDTVGDYQIIGVLGAGGMGKVFKVRNTISDREYAQRIRSIDSPAYAHDRGRVPSRAEWQALDR